MAYNEETAALMTVGEPLLHKELSLVLEAEETAEVEPEPSSRSGIHEAEEVLTEYEHEEGMPEEIQGV